MTKVDRVCESIVERIASGALCAGDRLPSEERLTGDLGVSLGTVQKALGRLARDGVVSREHGRGTFVSGARAAVADVQYLRFRDVHGLELAQYVRLRSVRRDARAGPWRDFLGQAAPIRIERTIDVDGRFVLNAEFWLREDDFARLDDTGPRALETNLRVLLGRRLALPALRVDRSISFVAPPAAVARRIGLSPRQPGFAMEMRGHTVRDRPLFYQRVFAPPFAERLTVTR